MPKTIDKQHLRLGKLAPKRDYRTLHLSDYLHKPAIEKAPKRVNYSQVVPEFGMLLNDQLGCCTIAGALHLNQVIDDYCNPSTIYEPTDEQVLEGYRRICGYDPSNPGQTDNGGYLLDVLNAWRKDGIGGRKIEAFAKVNHRSANDVRAALHIFGGLYAGVQLPISAQKQKIWDVVRGRNGERGSWGGHCINFHDYDSRYITCITWGDRQKMTWRYFYDYVDEAYVVISKDWLDEQGKTPTGLDLDGLMSDLGKVATP